ncbi:hypothetical protein ACOSQ2_003565 [Xanthoceras sorbifolium]
MRGRVLLFDAIIKRSREYIIRSVANGSKALNVEFICDWYIYILILISYYHIYFVFVFISDKSAFTETNLELSNPLNSCVYK